jgi:hypothetical protein
MDHFEETSAPILGGTFLMARIAMRNALLAAMMAAVLSGCTGPEWTAPHEYADPSAAVAPPPTLIYNNPIFIPIANHDCVWEEMVAVISGYFRIAEERPIRMAGTTATEGLLTTVPEVSPTIFEPWRHDTVDQEQRIENTLQTMRRRAVVHVIPAPEQGGHWVHVAVFKELEDNRHPEYSTAGAATLRYDSSLTRIINPVTDEPITKGWIGKGRDTSLEQYIIGDLLSRCSPPSGGPVVVPAQSARPAPQTPGPAR